MRSPHWTFPQTNTEKEKDCVCWDRAQLLSLTHSLAHSLSHTLSVSPSPSLPLLRQETVRLLLDMSASRYLILQQPEPCTLNPKP